MMNQMAYNRILAYFDGGPLDGLSFKLKDSLVSYTFLHMKSKVILFCQFLMSTIETIFVNMMTI